MPDRRSLTTDASLTVDSFLQQLDPDGRRAFLSLRAMLVSLGPDVREHVHEDHVCYHRARPFVEARLVRGRLQVAFPDGSRLDDPLGRLLRKGQERHLRLSEPDDLDGHVQSFVREAYTHARD